MKKTFVDHMNISTEELIYTLRFELGKTGHQNLNKFINTYNDFEKRSITVDEALSEIDVTKYPIKEINGDTFVHPVIFYKILKKLDPEIAEIYRKVLRDFIPPARRRRGRPRKEVRR